MIFKPSCCLSRVAGCVESRKVEIDTTGEGCRINLCPLAERRRIGVFMHAGNEKPCRRSLFEESNCNFNAIFSACDDYHPIGERVARSFKGLH